MADAGHRVFITRRIPKGGMDVLREEGDLVLEVWPGRLPPPPEELRSGAADADGLFCLLTDSVDERLMDAAPRLRVISNLAVGYDNIDVRAATERGITVTNTPGVLTEATADFTFALLMAAARRILDGDRAVRSGEWITWEPEFLLGRDVHGSVLGIIGMGRIGEAVARRARGFDMNILYSDVDRNPWVEDELGAEWVDLAALLGRADFISVHVPLTPETRGLLGWCELDMVKPGAVLINTSRGEVVDEEALLHALGDGRLAAAGLDVFATEPLPTDHPLTRLDNVVLAPHLGSASVQARNAMARTAASNLLSGLRGQRPAHVVNPEVLKE